MNMKIQTIELTKSLGLQEIDNNFDNLQKRFHEPKSVGIDSSRESINHDRVVEPLS